MRIHRKKAVIILIIIIIAIGRVILWHNIDAIIHIRVPDQVDRSGY